MSDKRGPGRPLTPGMKRPGRPRGSSPNGNPEGSEGNPLLALRLEPEVMEQVRARGGQAWVKALIRQALQAPE